MRIGQKGFTLVEIIVSLAIMTIVAGSVGAFIVAGNNSYLRGSKELTLQEEAQLTANQVIDLIIDVEKDIQFLDSTGAAVALDGTPAQDASGNVINSTNVSELRLYNNDNVYMIRWQGDDGSGYDTANQIYLYEAKNSVTTDADGNETIVWGDLTAEDVKPALMAEHVTSFNVDISEAKTTRKVVLKMTFAYMEKTYTIAETIKLRNDLSKENSEPYMWITGLKINPTHADLKQGQTAVFTFEFTGDSEAVAEAKAKGVEWSVSKQDGSACKSTINVNGKLSVADDENFGDNILKVTCTSVADPTIAATATVTVKAQQIDSLVISPKDGEVKPGGTLAFSCTMTGKQAAIDQGVNWVVTRKDGSALASGTGIASTGAVADLKALLTAGFAEKQGAGVLRVTCTSIADPSMSDTAYVTVAKIEGKYTVELIAERLTTYEYDDNSKIGYCAVIECLTSWADYAHGYPIIEWVIDGDSSGYQFVETKDKNPYQIVLECGTHLNETVTVGAWIKLDKDNIVYKTIDIHIPNLLATEKKSNPYIQSDQFVLFRNGRVECELVNYTGDASQVKWRIANDRENGLAPEYFAEKDEAEKHAWDINEQSKRLVGFSKYYYDANGELNFDFSYGNSNSQYDSTNSTRRVSASATGQKVFVWAKHNIDMNTEYRLELQAYIDVPEGTTGSNIVLNEEGKPIKIIAETELLIPQCNIYFPNGNRYLVINQGEDIDINLIKDKKQHCGNGENPGLYSCPIIINMYGFANTNTVDQKSQLATNGAGLTKFDAKIEADEPINPGTKVSKSTISTEGGELQITIQPNESSKMLYLTFSDPRLEHQLEIKRALVIYWNRKDNK